VLLHRALREEERFRDRAVALALGDLAQDLALPIRELVERRVLHLRASPDERLDDLGVDHRAARRDGVDRSRELGAVVDPLLEQVGTPVRAALEQRECVQRVRELAQHDDAHLRMTVAQLHGDPDSLVRVRRGHSDVGDHYVGLLAVASVPERIGVAYDSDDL